MPLPNGPWLEGLEKWGLSLKLGIRIRVGPSWFDTDYKKPKLNVMNQGSSYTRFFRKISHVKTWNLQR